MNELRVLVFSAKFGAGHFRAAEALIESIYEIHPDAKVTHLDCGAVLNKTFNTVLKDFYLGMIKRTPKLWGEFYYGTAAISPDSGFQRLLNNVGQHRYLKCINAVQPDIIICTYPTVAGVLSQLKLKKALNIPLVTVVTDYAIHSQWIHAGVDLYIVGCDHVYEGFVDRGIDPERIKVTGIPVSPRFERPIDRSEVLARTGLSADLPTVLVMGGAYGVLDDLKGVCKMLGDTSLPSQTIVVCGQNDSLYASLDEIIHHARNPMVRFGFVNNVEEFMTAADIVITKAGGLTVSEALTRGVPMLIFKPIPGQEEKNARFLESSGAARSVHNKEELEKVLYRLLTTPEEMARMRQAAANTLPGNSAEQAVGHILNLVKDQAEEAEVG